MIDTHRRLRFQRRARGALLAAIVVLPSAAATARPATAAPASCASTYVVQAGDSWSAISRATGIYIRPLAAANSMTKDSALHPGMELCVPAADSANSPKDRRDPSTTPSTTGPSTTGPSTTGPSTTGPSTTGPGATGPGATTPPPSTSTPANAPPTRTGPPAAGCAAAHEVVSGESWSSIAERHGLRLKAVLTANSATVDTLLHPGDDVCVPTAVADSPAERTPSTTEPQPTATGCRAIVAKYKRVMCVDLSERRGLIGGRSGITHDFAAVGGYGTVEQCNKTLAGTFSIGHKQPITPRRRLRWGISFGGGCVGDQIVHTVSRATMQSAQGTGGCIGLLEADAKAAYDVLEIGDSIVIVN